MNIVLLEPEIPANTGNIGRTCCATGSRLHLIEPMGFQINDKMLKRAGLDYWNELDVTVYDCYEDFLQKNPDAAGNVATKGGGRRWNRLGRTGTDAMNSGSRLRHFEGECDQY